MWINFKSAWKFQIKKKANPRHDIIIIAACYIYENEKRNYLPKIAGHTEKEKGRERKNRQINNAERTYLIFLAKLAVHGSVWSV